MSLPARALAAAALACTLSACSTLPGPRPIKDTIPPVVSALQLNYDPQPGKTTLTVEASDNIGVTRVDFYASDVFVGSVTAAPYTVQLPTYPPYCSGLEAKVYDAAGNHTSRRTIVPCPAP